MSMARLVFPQAEGKAPVTYRVSPAGEVSLTMSMCSASQWSSRAMTEAIRRAKHFLPSRAIVAVARAVGPDLSGLKGKWTMYLFSSSHGHGTSVAWPARHGACADRVEAGHELTVGAEHLEGAAAHAGHDPHGHGHVGRVGDLDPDVGDGRPQRPHGEGDDVHGAPPHRALEQVGQDGAHLGRVPPVVGRAGIDTSRVEQMKVRSSTRATSPGSEWAQ